MFARWATCGACVISRTIVVNLYVRSLPLQCYLLSCVAQSAPSRPLLIMCMTLSDSNAKRCHECEGSMRIRASWTHTHRGVSTFPRHDHGPVRHMHMHAQGERPVAWERGYPCVCVRRVLAGDSCVLDAHTHMGVCVPTPHNLCKTLGRESWAMCGVAASLISKNIVVHP